MKILKKHNNSIIRRPISKTGNKFDAYNAGKFIIAMYWFMDIKFENLLISISLKVIFLPKIETFTQQKISLDIPTIDNTSLAHHYSNPSNSISFIDIYSTDGWMELLKELQNIW